MLGWMRCSCCPAVWLGNLPDLSEPCFCPVWVTSAHVVLWLRCSIVTGSSAGLGLAMA